MIAAPRIRSAAIVLAVLVEVCTGCGGSSSSGSPLPKDAPAAKLAALDYLGGSVDRDALTNLDSRLTAGKYSP